MGGGHEFLEHTADIGIRSWGASLEEALEHAVHGLVELMGARVSGRGDRRRLRLEADDVETLLVDLLNEIVLLHEAEAVGVASVRVRRATETTLDAEIEVAPIAAEPEGVGVKAATYHQVRVERSPDGRAVTQAYLDV